MLDSHAPFQPDSTEHVTGLSDAPPTGGPVRAPASARRRALIAAPVALLAIAIAYIATPNSAPAAPTPLPVVTAATPI